MSDLTPDQIQSLANVLKSCDSKSRTENISVEYDRLNLSNASSDEIRLLLLNSNYVVVSVKSFTVIVDKYLGNTFSVALCDSSIQDDRIFNVNVFNDARFKNCPWLIYFNSQYLPWKGENIPLDTLVDIIRWLKMITSAFA